MFCTSFCNDKVPKQTPLLNNFSQFSKNPSEKRLLFPFIVGVHFIFNNPSSTLKALILKVSPPLDYPLNPRQ